MDGGPAQAIQHAVLTRLLPPFDKPQLMKPMTMPSPYEASCDVFKTRLLDRNSRREPTPSPCDVLKPRGEP
jgi:hypothetical protein